MGEGVTPGGGGSAQPSSRGARGGGEGAGAGAQWAGRQHGVAGGTRG